MQVLTTRGVQFPNGMPQVMGSRSYHGLRLATSSARHIRPAERPLNPERVTQGFAAALSSALANVEALDVRSQRLTAQAVYNPDSVNAHTLIIAGEKARFALNLTKSLADGVIRAYRELTTPR